MNITCSTCSMYVAYDSETAQGVCHRYPPTPLKSDNVEITSSFPVTRADMWCGEHRA